MPDFRSINRRLSTPQSAYSGYGGTYGYAAGGPYGRARSMPMLPGAKKDWDGAAGDVDRCSAVAICLGWLQDQFSQARLQVGSWPDPATFAPAASHALLDLVGPEGRPNDDYDSDALFAASILSWKMDGNVFWLKARGSGGFGGVLQLFWEPHFNVTPWHEPGDPRQVSWYYVSRPEGLYRVPREDVVHMRDGVDKFNPMLGYARLRAAIRAVVGHSAAETYEATIVDSMGGLGAVWSPAGEPIEEDEALGIASMVRRQTTGENSGRFLALTVPGAIDRVALGPQEMALDSIPDRFESTICAAMGVSPMVVGLAAGASMRSYANQAEADRQSWNNGLVPMQHRFARAIQSQLLPDFGGRAKAVRFDHSAVPALQANAESEATRAVQLAGGPVATTNEARAIVGLKPVPGGDELAPKADPNQDPATQENDDAE